MSQRKAWIADRGKPRAARGWIDVVSVVYNYFLQALAERSIVNVKIQDK